MDDQVFKLLIPIAQLIFFFIYMKRKIKGISLLFGFYIFMFFSLSSNFTFYYRDIGQVLSIIVFLASLNKIKNYNLLDLKGIIKPLIIFLIFILISAYNVINYKLYFDTIINFLLTITIIVTIIVNIKDRFQYSIFLNIFVVNSLFLSVITVIQYFALDGIRIEAPFSNPNYLAILLSVGFVIILTRPFLKYYYLKLILIITAISFTGSRAILLMVLICFFINELSQKNFRSKIILLTGVFIFSSLIVSKSFEESRYSRVGNDISITSRFEIFEIVKNTVDKNPITGIGYGQFISSFKNYIPLTKINDFDLVLEVDEIVTHNDFLRVISELGVFALIYFSLLFFKQIIKSIKLYRVGFKNEFYFLLIFLGFSMTHNNMNSFLFWLILLLPNLTIHIFRNVR